MFISGGNKSANVTVELIISKYEDRLVVQNSCLVDSLDVLQGFATANVRRKKEETALKAGYLCRNGIILGREPHSNRMRASIWEGPRICRSSRSKVP